MKRLLGLVTALIVVLSFGVATHAEAASPPATKTVTIQPVTSSLHLARGWSIAHTYKADSCTSSIVNPADLRCFATNNGVYDPCWPYQSSAKAARAAVCPEAVNSHKLIKISGTGKPSTSTTKKPYRWAFRLTSGNYCYLSTGTGDTFHGKPINYFCAHNIALIGAINKSHTSWTVREVIYSKSGSKKYGPIAHISTAYNAGSYRALIKAPAKHACTKTSSGTCIQGGEFCPKASYGTSGWDANGRRYVCTGSTTHPHWELP